MLLFDSVVFGAFVGFLTDVWLARFKVSDPTRFVIAVVVGAIVGFLVELHQLSVF